MAELNDVNKVTLRKYADGKVRVKKVGGKLYPAQFWDEFPRYESNSIDEFGRYSPTVYHYTIPTDCLARALQAGGEVE